MVITFLVYVGGSPTRARVSQGEPCYCTSPIVRNTWYTAVVLDKITRVVYKYTVVSHHITTGIK